MPFPFVQYEANLTGLMPDTEYQYFAAVDGQAIGGPDAFGFRTAGPGPFNFVVFGDSGQASPQQLELVSRIANERPAFVLHTGDIAYMQGTFEQFDANYFRYYGPVMNSVPFFPTPGNHDYMTDGAAAYVALHSVPQQTVPAGDRGRYYSFDWGNAHFVSLDSNTSLEQAIAGTGSMLEWLENDLRSTQQFWRIVFFHHPPYAAGPNQSDVLSTLARERIVPILEKYGVQVVFNGHEHAYHRSRLIRDNAVTTPGEGTVYITSGGGGASLYDVFAHPLLEVSKSNHHYVRAEVSGTQLTLRAIGVDGNEIDSFRLAPPPAIAEDGQGPAISFSTIFQEGAMFRITGRGLAAEQRYAPAGTVPIPGELGGTTVTLNDRPISLLYVSSGEIYGRVPFKVPGSVTLRVMTPNGSTETSIRIPWRRLPKLPLI
jgi:hypothetical protein